MNSKCKQILVLSNFYHSFNKFFKISGRSSNTSVEGLEFFIPISFYIFTLLVPVEYRHSVTGRNDQKLTNQKSHYQIRSEVLK